MSRGIQEIWTTDDNPRTWPSRSGSDLITGQFHTDAHLHPPGQLKLKYVRVLIVGLGGLGSPAAAYLAGAGVGKIGLIDGDTVELSNVHRQIIHTTGNVGMLKVESAAQYLKQ